MKDEGVFQLDPSAIQWHVNVHQLARNMAILMQHGWPATFLLMFDEVWGLIHRARGLMAATTGNACNMDVLCWYVDPNRGDAGFSPHRDRQPADSPSTFRASDGSPMYSTCWVPLTDACPENSCLYMVPRWADPGYFPGDDDDGPDPLSVALSSKESYQAIRAFPAQAGTAIIFSHRIIHWGSRGRKGHHTPRLAVSWGCADDAFEPPYFSREHLPYPPMTLRAALACGQMLVYHERFSMTRRQLSLYYKFFTAHAASFHMSYRAKVADEFVAATKEAVAAPLLTAVGPTANGGGQGDGKGAMARGKEGKAKGKAGKADGAACAATAAAAAAAAAPKAAQQGTCTREASSQAAKAVEAEDGLSESAKKKRKEKRKKKHAAGDGSAEGSDGGAADAEEAGAGGEGMKAGKGPKRVKKAAAAAGVGEEVTEAQLGKLSKAAVGATAQVTATIAGKAAAGAEKGAAVKKKASKDKKSERKAVASAVETKITAKAAGAGKSPSSIQHKRHKQDDDEEEEEEEGPGWEGLLQGGGCGELDSEDEVMEDALDAMLDAELAGRGDALQDDFDDFQDDM